MSDLELVEGIKRDLIRKRTEIDAMKYGSKKKKAIKAYIDLCLSLEMDYAS